MEIPNKTKHLTEEDIDKLLNEYETKLGLPKFEEHAPEDNKDVKYYLSLTKPQLEKLSVLDCAEGAFLISRLAFHIQRSYNREMAKAGFLESNLKAIIFGKESNYKGSWDSQFMQAVKDNVAAFKIFKLKTYVEQRAAQINYLHNSIRNISEMLTNVQKAKFGDG